MHSLAGGVGVGVGVDSTVFAVSVCCLTRILLAISDQGPARHGGVEMLMDGPAPMFAIPANG